MKDYLFPDGYSDSVEEIEVPEENEKILETILKHGENNILCEELEYSIRKIAKIMLQFTDIECVIRIMEEIVDSEILTRFP